ncbi:unannotated protein [freshwater metagenome]|uniref:Unannotated protein n=1 Tax=freshwater metagenome TaxID=449393 RepID=A0A6J7DL35_9ZZZZ|nr:ROK family protein [Actinomycetota bacterium]
MLNVGVDIGGTKTVVGLVADDGTIVASHKVATPTHDGALIVEATVGAIERVMGQERPLAIGIGVAGLVDRSGAEVLFAPHLDFANFPLAQVVQQRTGLDCVLENDATATAWAEYRFGAGRDCRSIVAVTVGTGLGGGIILNGELIRGANGTAGEIGHIPWVRDGLPCACGSLGCLEQYVSGTSLTRKARTLVDEQRSTYLHKACEGDSQQLTGAMVTDGARAGDAQCLGLLNELGHELGAGLSAMVATVDPDIVVIGGGVSSAGELLLQPAREAFAARVIGAHYRELPPIVLAECGEDAAMIGAADLARGLTR